MPSGKIQIQGYRVDEKPKGRVELRGPRLAVLSCGLSVGWRACRWVSVRWCRAAGRSVEPVLETQEGGRTLQGPVLIEASDGLLWDTGVREN